MSFEKQFCEQCGNLRFCVDTRSIDAQTYRGKPLKQKWLCELCLAWSPGYAQRKDTIRSIMITCGIEDIESN